MMKSLFCQLGLQAPSQGYEMFSHHSRSFHKPLSLRGCDGPSLGDTMGMDGHLICTLVNTPEGVQCTSRRQLGMWSRPRVVSPKSRLESGGRTPEKTKQKKNKKQKINVLCAVLAGGQVRTHSLQDGYGLHNGYIYWICKYYLWAIDSLAGVARIQVGADNAGYLGSTKIRDEAG
jgi:hypothetical protein